MNRPHCLFENLAALSGCINVIYEMMQQKQFFTLPYFNFIDYIIQNPIIAPPIFGLLEILKHSSIELDLPWKDALLKYSNVENGKHGKKEVYDTTTKLAAGF